LLQDVSSAPSSIFVPWDDASFADMEVYLAQNGIEILMASSDEGQRHVVADGLVAKERCNELTQLDVVCSSAVHVDSCFCVCVFLAHILKVRFSC